MVENADKSLYDAELGPEITGTVLTSGRRTASGRFYSRKVLQRIASDVGIQTQIRTHSFVGKVRGVSHESSSASHLVTYLGLEEGELRASIDR
jgi:hypothetical protein